MNRINLYSFKKVMFLISFILIPFLGVSASVYPQVKGWKLSETAETYSPDDLFAYINGAADLYLSYHFTKLEVREYLKEGTDDYIKVEVYEHEDVKNAYGIYTQERPPEKEVLDIGAQAYAMDKALNFFTGPYYVKIYSYAEIKNLQNTIQTLGGKLAMALNPDPRFPEALGFFPGEGLVEKSKTFISSNFIGHDFLHSAFQATYKLNGKKIKAFIIQGDNPEDSRQMLKAYFEFSGLDKKIQEGNTYRIPDKYNGELHVILQGKYLVGVMSGELEQAEEILKGILASIPSKK
jgi:hypothetical protein